MTSTGSNELILLTDASVKTQDKVGYGAFLVLTPDEALKAPAELKTKIQLRRFEQTSSTKLELQTLLWAFEMMTNTESCLTVYSDSQNIIGLPARRQRLECQNFCSSSGRRLNNADLYREFYRWTDRLKCTFLKVRGHQPTRTKNAIDQLFSLVDRAARTALRAD